MLNLKTRIDKGGELSQEKNGGKLYRLTEIEPDFVSLVGAGANRQKAFQVVKADGSASPEGEATNQETQTQQPEEIGSGDVDTGTDKKGDDDTNGSTEWGGADLTSWLEEAGASVDAISLDTAIQRALDSQQGDEPSSSSHTKQALEIGETDLPAVEMVLEETEEDPRDAKIAQLEAKLRKQALELTTAKARAGRLAKGVGQSSVMVTGEVKVAEKKTPDRDTSPSKGAFSSGGDMAAAVIAGGR